MPKTPRHLRFWRFIQFEPVGSKAFEHPPEVATIACVALVEAAAEKLVALPRRAGAELADAGGPRDPTLVRHVYDLHMLRGHYDFA